MEENNTVNIVEENEEAKADVPMEDSQSLDNSQQPDSSEVSTDSVDLAESVEEDNTSEEEVSQDSQNDNIEKQQPEKTEETDLNDDVSKESDGDNEEDEEDEEESFTDLKGDWYILQVFTGHENKVKLSIEQRVVDMGFQEKVFKVLVPMEDTVEIKNNKRVESRKKMYPGYVFINMTLEDDVWYAVRRISGIVRFIGGEDKPEPIQETEMLRVLKQVGAKVKKIEINLEIGETIRVIAGPFRGYTGVIKEINPERGKVKVLMSIFGRETPMELEFDQLEKNT